MPQYYQLLQVFLNSATAGYGPYGSIVTTKGICSDTECSEIFSHL